MTQYENASGNPRDFAEQVLSGSRAALQRAVSIVSPANPEDNPQDVFPAPGELRADDIGIALTDEQQAQLRSAAAELGFGRNTDRTLSEQGIKEGYAIIEGGQPHKMLAEAEVVLKDEGFSPSTIFFAATPNRKIDNLAEQASAKNLTGKIGETEYQVAIDLIKGLPNFEEVVPNQVLPVSYDIDRNYSVGTEQTGQFVLMGHVDDTPVVLMRIDREDFVDEDGNKKYRKQPDAADTIGIVSGVTAADGSPDLPIGLVTSSTYEASRNVDAARAAIILGRVATIASYGTEHLASVKGEQVPAPAAINQLPGELHKAAQQVAKLEAILSGEV